MKKGMIKPEPYTKSLILSPNQSFVKGKNTTLRLGKNGSKQSSLHSLNVCARNPLIVDSFFIIWYNIRVNTRRGYTEKAKKL